MKKFDIKKLLILVLALVMVFALVACNKPTDGGGGDTIKKPTPKDDGDAVTAAVYFQELWNATKSIGNDAIGEDDGIKIELGLDIALTANGGDPFDLGILLGIVYDPTGAQSAAKVKLYDKAAPENWLTLYLFMDEPDMLYISFKDQNVALPFDTDGTDNGTYADAIHGFLNNAVLDSNKDETLDTSIVDIIASITSDFGPDWTLDNLIFSLFNLLGLDLGTIVDGLSSVVGDIEVDEDAQSLLPVLVGLGDLLFPDGVPYETVDGITTYTAEVGTDLMEILPTFIGSYVGNLITPESTLELIFSKSDEEIESFGIHLYTENFPQNQPFDLKLTIDALKIDSLGESLTAAKAQEALGFVKSDFSENSKLAFDLEIGIVGNALVLNPGETAADLDGYFKLHLEGQLNLNEGENTQATAYIAYKQNANDAYVNLIEAAVSPDPANAAKSQLVLDFNSAHPMTQAFMTYVGPSIVQGLVGSDDPVLAGAGQLIASAAYEEGAFNTSFEGVVLENIDIDELFQGLLAGIGGEDASAAAEPEPAAWAINVPKLISTIIDALGYNDGMISLAVDKANGGEAGIANLIASLFKNVSGSNVALFGNDKVNGIFGQGGSAVLDDNGTPEDPSDDYGWWSTFFAGSSWAAEIPESATNAQKLAAEKATITNLFSSGVEITINNKPAAQNPDKGEITIAIENGNSASITVSLLINVTEADSAYVTANTLRPATSVIAVDAADGIYSGWVLLSIPSVA